VDPPIVTTAARLAYIEDEGIFDVPAEEPWELKSLDWIDW
jgi:hypothetical protein